MLKKSELVAGDARELGPPVRLMAAGKPIDTVSGHAAPAINVRMQALRAKIPPEYEDHGWAGYFFDYLRRSDFSDDD